MPRNGKNGTIIFKTGLRMDRLQEWGRSKDSPFSSQTNIPGALLCHTKEIFRINCIVFGLRKVRVTFHVQVILRGRHYATKFRPPCNAVNVI